MSDGTPATLITSFVVIPMRSLLRLGPVWEDRIVAHPARASEQKTTSATSFFIRTTITLDRCVFKVYYGIMTSEKLPERKSEDERILAPDEKNESTSDNQYQDTSDNQTPNIYTAAEVARWIYTSQGHSITPTRIRQLAAEHGVGRKRGNYWHFTYSDIIIMGKLTRRGKKPMRNVTTNPETMLRQLEVSDDFKAYLNASWRQLHDDLSNFLHDVSSGLFGRLYDSETKVHNSQVKFEWRMQDKLNAYRGNLNETIRKLTEGYDLGKIAVNDLRAEIELLKKQLEDIEVKEHKKKGGKGGWGVLTLAGAAPLLPLSGYGAEAA